MKNWFDEAYIEVRSGDGGRGCESYLRRTDKKREPNGGNGGKGGDVWIEADSNMTGLIHFKYNQHFQSESGREGSSGQKAGRSGSDLVVKVPCGTCLINSENKLRIRDLIRSGDRVMIAKGGRGGAGNHTGNPAKLGAPGETLRVLLDLKIDADVFLIGTPGAGKSALLHRLTNAHQEEKVYPFSTKAPHLGVYEFPDYSKVTLCELPSLMEGSSEGHGLGNRYLKHLERGRVAFWVLETKSDFAENLNTAYNIIKSEVEFFDKEYVKRPYICLINKSDLMDDEERKAAEETVKTWKVPFFFVSAKTGEGLDKIMQVVQGGSYYG